MPSEVRIPRVEIEAETYWSQFAIASEASEEDLARLRADMAGLTELSADTIEACYAIRSYLIDRGYSYNDKIFKLGDIEKSKSGNCLGLALLFGAILKECGHEPEFEIVLTPKDAVYKRELDLLEALNRGEYFPYDNPGKIPSKNLPHPQLRFAPLEHPAIIVSGDRRFETTSLDNETDPEVTYEAELLRRVTYSEVSSGIYIDQAKYLLNEGEVDYGEIRSLIGEGLKMWSENREAYALLWEVATAAGDPVIANEALDRYKQVGGKDSRYFFELYKIVILVQDDEDDKPA